MFYLSNPLSFFFLAIWIKTVHTVTKKNGLVTQFLGHTAANMHCSLILPTRFLSSAKLTSIHHTIHLLFSI